MTDPGVRGQLRASRGSPGSGRAQRGGTRLMRALACIAAVVAVGAVSACGSPQYCSDKDALKKSVNGLKNVDLLKSGGLDRLKQQLTKVQSDAKALAGSAKDDLPAESGAVRSSVTALATDAKQIPSSPEPAQLARLGADIKAVVSSFGNFSDAAKNKC